MSYRQKYIVIIAVYALSAIVAVASLAYVVSLAIDMLMNTGGLKQLVELLWNGTNA